MNNGQQTCDEKKKRAIEILKGKLKYYHIKYKYADSNQKIAYYSGMIEGIKIGLSVIGEL